MITDRQTHRQTDRHTRQTGPDIETTNVLEGGKRMGRGHH